MLINTTLNSSFTTPLFCDSVVFVIDFRGKKIYEPPRFMTVGQAADQLLQIIHRRREEGEELGESPDLLYKSF